MRYYTIKALAATDGTETRDMRGFDSLDEAVVRFHTDMAGAIGKDTTTKVLCMVINEDGGIYKTETWAAAEEAVAE